MTVPFIRNIRINNLLSFGPESPGLELRALNVLIGPNGSGKTNLIEVLGFLQSTSKDLSEPIRQGGGITEWLWKGAGKVAMSGMSKASVEILVEPEKPGNQPHQYRIVFTTGGNTVEILNESIDNNPPGAPMPDYLYVAYRDNFPEIRIKGEIRKLKADDVNLRQSILSRRKDPDQYPEITYLGQKFSEFMIYRDWEFGADSKVRRWRVPDQQLQHLERDASNLALMINRMKVNPPVKAQLLRYLKEFYRDAEDVDIVVAEALVGFRLEERGISTPAVRLSAGTLRWLSLLAILLNPTPPPVVCIEEPELGLHPDIIPILAKLLIEASQRMQLIVTTHSDLLVEALSEMPESVVVCEKQDGSTTLRRLEKSDLSKWLGEYSLGELWRKDEIGGTRW